MLNKEYWLSKWNIPKDSDVLFYQNPKLFMSNSFKKESLNGEFDSILEKVGKVKIYLITGESNKHNKHNGRRKICLVKEYLK